MKYAVIAIALLCMLLLKAQENYPVSKLPVFKQVTHPFMPPITSEFFFFSEDGLEWFSTAHGLTSFDGSEVTYYSSVQQANVFGLPAIAAMAEDNSHNFYIGTPFGLYYYDRATKLFSNLTYTFSDIHKQNNISITVLHCDENGMVYAGTANNGLFVYNPINKKMEHFNLDASKPDSWSNRRLNTVSSLAVHATDKNKLWTGSFHGIYLFDKQKKTFYQNFEVVNPVHYLASSTTTGTDTSAIPEHYDIAKMDVADDSTIWFNCWAHGFGKYNTNTGKVKLFLQNKRLNTPLRNIGYIIRQFARLSPGKYLLGIYDDKTAVFDTQTEMEVYFKINSNNVSEEQTQFVTNDHKGNAWLMQKGFLYVAIPEDLLLQPVIVPNTTIAKIQHPIVRGIYFDTTSHLFYGCFLNSSGVHVYDSNFNQAAIIPAPLTNNYYTYNATVNTRITKDGSGRFWAIGWKTIVRMPGEKEFLPIEKKIPPLAWLGAEGAFNDITTSRNGDILVKRNNGTVYCINHLTFKTDSIPCPVMEADGVEIKNASAWYDDKRNFIYLTSNSGVAQFNLSNREMKIVPNASLFGSLPANQGVCAPALDATGRIWFMIPKYGIRIIDPISLVCTDSVQYGNNGLMRGDYTAIAGGSAHYILFRSQNGIVVYDFVKQKSFLFDHTNGLSSPDNKSFLYSNGYLFIGQSGRFEYFKLSGLDNYFSSIAAGLNSITVDTTIILINKVFNEAQPVKLPYYQNTLAFSFSAPEFFFPERIEYAYQLTPVDNNWHYTNYFNRKIIYTQLAPGKYVFRLKAQMQGDNWNIKAVEYTVIILPAWWQQGWFRILSVIAASVLVFYFIRKRIQFIKKTEQQKSKHEKELLELEAKALRAQMNPHFIFNCLNSIKSLIQLHEEEKSVAYLTTFSKLIRTLFNNADKKEISLYDEIETCKFYLQLEAMRFDAKFSYAVNIDDTIDLKSVQVPAMIIQPFLENAIWHGIVPGGAGSELSLSVRGTQDEGIEITIEDNGIGREASYQNKPASGLTHQSKGVSLTQSRLELDNLLQQRQASIAITDKKDEKNKAAGTQIVITIKEEI